MLIISKYPGICSVCHRAIDPGDRIEWTRGQRAVQHAECSSDGRKAAEAAEASRATDAAIEVPAPSGREYLPFQRAGIAYASKRAGTLLADEMGLGKTIQAIGLINSDPSLEHILVVCPKSLTLNWERELRRWLVRRDLHVSRSPASPVGIRIVGFDQAIGLVETKQPAPGAVGRPDRYGRCYRPKPTKVAHPVPSLDRDWDLIIIDECHLVKNPKAQRTQVVQALAKRARRRLTLTGTPIVNRPAELWTILQITDPASWDADGKGWWRFRRYTGGYHSAELQQRLRETCMVRRLKADVLTELPAKRRQIVELPANGAAQAIAAETSAWDARQEALDGLRAAVELAKASDNPADYAQAVSELQEGLRAAFEEMSRIRRETAVAKIPYVVEHVRMALEDDPSTKLVVMGHHHEVIDGIRDQLASFGAVSLTGRDSLDVRQAAVDRFQSDSACRVFVGSIQAAGVGITLTASSHVVFAELDWVPGNVSQAEDRVHRIGQTAESILIQHLVLEGSLDARMAEVLVAKQEVIDRSLDRKTENGSDVQSRPVVPIEPVVPGREAPATSGPRSDLDRVAATMTAERAAMIHSALRELAGVCDGARTLDGAGFSKIDVQIGISLASAPRLSARQAALGLKLVRKYRRQLGSLAQAILGEPQADPEATPSPVAAPVAAPVASPEPIAARSPEPPKAEPAFKAPESKPETEVSDPAKPARKLPDTPSGRVPDYRIRILSTATHDDIVGLYTSFRAVDQVLSGAATRAPSGVGSHRVDYMVTHVPTGATFVGRIELTHPSRRNWSLVSLARHTRQAAQAEADLLAHYGGAPERIRSLRSWAERLAPAPKAKRAAA